MMKKLIAACLVFLALTACENKTGKGTEAPAQQPQPPSKVLDYLSLSAHFLINQQRPDGFFKYEYDFITGNYTDWDNVVHQTRAGYTLIQYYSFLIRNNIDAQLASIVLASTTKALRGYADASVVHDSMPGKVISFYYDKNAPAAARERRKTPAKQRIQRLEAEIAATAFALMTEMYYWNATSDNAFAGVRKEWRDALVYHAGQALKTPARKSPFMPFAWQALAIYTQIVPDDKEARELLSETDAYFMSSPRPMKGLEDYTWDMVAANLRYQTTQQPAFVNYAARQTVRLLEDLYTQHDTTVNSCGLSLGLVDASLILSGKTGDFLRIEQTALGRSQLEYYSSLKYTILPNQTWITLGPMRTLHSQDFKRFAGAGVFGMHMPRTNIGLTELCLLTGMRFSNEDIKEIKQVK